MNNSTLEHFTQLFNNILDEAKNEDLVLNEALTQNANGDLVDQAMGNRDQQLALKLQGRQGFFIKKVEHALTKIDKGTFGQCEECGESISQGRLLARPTATQCIGCKEEQEIDEQHITYQKKSHTHGNGFSHKSVNNNVVQLKLNDDNKDQRNSRKSLNL